MTVQSLEVTVIARLLEEVNRLRAALAPFSWYYSVNDCADSDQKYMEVPVSDLRRAFEVHPVTEMPDEQSLLERGPTKNPSTT